MKTKNLFGEEVEIKKKPRSFYQLFKSKNRYRESETTTRSCKNCTNLIKKEFHNGRYKKCKLIGESNSEATDIRLKDVCDKWKKVDG